METTLAGLVDLERDLATIQEQLDHAAAGSDRSLTVYGGIGSGKSALLAAAAAQARERQFAVLQVRGDYAERDLHFALAARLFEPVRTVERRLTSRLPNPVGGGADDETTALHQLLTRLATRSPVLVAVDDVHWADRASLRWLTLLQQRLERSRIALVVSVCGGDTCVDPALLDELLAASAHELRPGSLGVAATATMLERVLDDSAEPSFVAACAAATGGNPLLVTSIAAALAARRIEPTVAAIVDLRGIDLPRLGTALKVRLRRVSSDALTFAGAIAVLGDDATVDRVSDITGITMSAVTELTTALSSMEVVRVTGTHLSFTFPVLRDVVLREVPFAALRAVKTQAARLLQADDAPEESIADQLLITPPLAEPWVPDVLRSAAKRALLAGSASTATAYLRRALTEPVAAAVQTELLSELGAAEAHVDLRSAIRHFTKAIERASSDPATNASLAELLALTGQSSRAIEVLERHGPDEVDEHNPRLLELRLEQAETAGPALAALAVASRTSTLAHHEPRLLSLFALREVWEGTSRATAIGYAEQALALTLGDLGHTATNVRAVLVLADAGRPEDAYERCTALVDAAARRGHQPWLAAAHSARSAIGRQLGLLPGALQDAQTSLDLILGCGGDRGRGTAVEILARLIHILVDVGSHAEAEGLLELASLTGDVRRSWAGTTLLLARGRLRVAAGHPAEGARDLFTAGVRLEAWRVTNPAVAPWRSELALALYELGDNAEAHRYATEEVARAREWGAPAPLGLALRSAACVVRGSGGRATLEEAVTLLDGTPAQLARAQCLTAYGIALKEARQLRAARKVLHDALAVAEQCQSPHLIDQARTQLTAAGGRRSKIRRGGVAGLTPAERRVVALAAGGRTNRAIAEHLFVRLRTVEIHLTNAYRKLGIAGRDQLAQAIQRRPTQSEPATG